MKKLLQEELVCNTKIIQQQDSFSPYFKRFFLKKASTAYKSYLQRTEEYKRASADLKKRKRKGAAKKRIRTSEKNAELEMEMKGNERSYGKKIFKT